ncbi:MAG: wax ester/triacylglycerol synthase family O-acyltransferase [Thermoleophilaceae bacterium]
MSRRPLPAADAAWLHMDRAANPMVVNALILFDEPLDWQRAKEVFGERLVERFPRFRQRVSDPLGRPVFEDDPGFDIDRHLHRLALPQPGDQTALQELVSDLITPGLDRSRPLWHVYLIEGFGEGCAVLVRIHHCIADGIALARVMLSLTDDEDEDGVLAPEPPDNGHGRGRLGSMLAPAATALAATRRITATVAHEGMESVVHPENVARLAGSAVRDAGTLARLLTAPADSRTVLKAPLHGTRRVAWSTPFPLARLKAAGRHDDATINDVLLAAVTGALRSYLEERDTLPDEVHVMVPFNLRPLDQPLPRRLGNEFALILLALPVGIEDPRERMRDVKMRMDAVKNSHEGAIAFGVLSAIGLTPAQLESRLIGFFSEKASAVVTNLPGPCQPVYLAGTPVAGVLVWAPCSGGLGLTVSIFSYAGEVTVGFMTDIGLVPEPQELVKAFDTELRTLCRGTRRRSHKIRSQHGA